jgi:hypothetical protein
MIFDPDNLVLGLKENQQSSERLKNQLKSQAQIIDDQITRHKEKNGQVDRALLRG